MKTFEEYLDPFRFENIMNEKYGVGSFDRCKNKILEQEKLYEGYFKSYDQEKFVRLLKNAGISNNDIQSYGCENEILGIYEETKVIAFVRNELAEKILSRIDSILKVSGWCMSSVSNTNYTTKIIFEKNTGQDVTDIVKNKFNGIVYHITDKKNVKSILTHGLKTHEDYSNNFFNHPDRTYFILDKDDFIDAAKTLYSSKHAESLVLLKVDLGMYYDEYKIDIKLFSDPMYFGAVYTKEDIYHDCIQCLDEEYFPDANDNAERKSVENRDKARELVDHLRKHPRGF